MDKRLLINRYVSATCESRATLGTLKKGGFDMASHKREEDECRWSPGTPSLHDLVPGKPCGAVLPLSEYAQTQIRDRIATGLVSRAEA